MDVDQIAEAFDQVFDEALLFHGFTDYMRDYDVFVQVAAAPRTRAEPEYLRYRFTRCVRASVTSATTAGEERPPVDGERRGRPCRTLQQ